MSKFITTVAAIFSLASGMSFAQSIASQTPNSCVEPKETMYENGIATADDLSPEKCSEMIFDMTKTTKSELTQYQCKRKQEKETICDKTREILYRDSLVAAEDLSPNNCADMVVKMTEIKKNPLVKYYCHNSKDKLNF